MGDAPNSTHGMAGAVATALCLSCLAVVACSAEPALRTGGVEPTGSSGVVEARARAVVRPSERDAGSVSQMSSVVATYAVFNEGGRSLEILNTVET